MADTGWKIAGAGASVNIGGGTGPWSTPSNITNTNDAQTSEWMNKPTSHNLVATNFGFSIPVGMSITGVESRIRRTCFSGSSDISDFEVRMIYNGALRGENKAKPDIWLNPGGVYHNIDYGGPTDAWGDTLTPAIVNNNTFGCSLRTQSSSEYGKTPAYVYTIWMRIHYEESGNFYEKVGGVWRKGQPYERVAGVWRPGKLYERVGGIWRS